MNKTHTASVKELPDSRVEITGTVQW
ncbi:MAG: hypothetical protein JWL92_242, partial [Candidatus Nomurabacteria bacterium]|nr:hypothetical protein [Candidatus Nomurabacteria bacterium]